jgi:hypothetical protein
MRRPIENNASPGRIAAGKQRWFFYSIKKEGDSRIFQAQDRTIDDFT